MNDIPPIVSPDQRFYILLGAISMRMSHEVWSGSLWQAAPRRLLLRLGEELWSTEQATWSPDSRSVAVELRRYPGDAPSIVLDIYPDRGVVLPRPPLDARAIPFESLDRFLEDYYRQHRRAPAVPPARTQTPLQRALSAILRWLRG